MTAGDKGNKCLGFRFEITLERFLTVCDIINEPFYTLGYKL